MMRGEGEGTILAAEASKARILPSERVIEPYHTNSSPSPSPQQSRGLPLRQLNSRDRHTYDAVAARIKGYMSR
jgi:hypothetical protein